MSDWLERLREAKIDWQASPESPYVFHASFAGTLIRLRLNDFPEAPLCTLLRDDRETNLDDWPKLWTLPRHRARKL